MLLDIFSMLTTGQAGTLLARPASPVEAADRAAHLREALVSETQTAALLTATLTSGANALTDKTSRIGPEDMLTYAPGDLSRLKILADMLTDVDHCVEEPIFVMEFVAGARVGDELLRSYNEDAAKLGVLRAAVLHRTGLCEAWRQICNLALLALREVDSFIGPELPEIYVQNSRVVTAFLSSAKNGRRPCVDVQGRLYLPPLPQQRRWPRRALLQGCTLRIRDKAFPAFARDVSAGGLGLDHVPSMSRGDMVTIELESGRSLKGLIAWSSGSTAGVRFPAALKPSDPLLMA